MARPKRTLADAEKLLPVNYKEEILLMYAEGFSDVEIQAYLFKKIGVISFKLWDRWRKEEKEFGDTIKYGQLLSEAWWRTHGREQLKNKEFNNVLWYMNMKNRFGWTDNQNVKHSGTIEHVGIIRTPEKKQLDNPSDTIVIESNTEEL